MNKQIYVSVYIAIFNNPVANILLQIGVNIKKFLKYAVLSSNFWETLTLNKGRQFKEPVFVAAIGIIMLPTSALPTVSSLPAQIAIGTMVAVGVVFGLLLSSGFNFKFKK